MPKPSTADSPADITLRFDAASGSVQLRTILDTLTSVSALAAALSPTLAPGRQLELRVRAPKRGSLLLHLSVSLDELLKLAQQVTDPENLKTILAIVGGIAGLLGLRKHLGKEPPKAVEPGLAEVSVTNSHGVTINIDKRVFQIYSDNRTVNAYIDRTFDALQADPEVNGFEVRDASGQPLFRAGRDEFGELREAPLLTAPPNERTQVDRCTLSIVKPSFDPKLRWQFILRGERIGAYVRDASFAQRVLARAEVFGVGDSLDVELRVTQVFDGSVGAYVNREHEVLTVFRHRQAARQQDFPFDHPFGGPAREP